MYLRNGKANIYYERSGHGQPLLIVHGAIEGTRYFKELVEILRDYYEVFTYDRRGNGRSTCEDGADFDLDAQVSDAAALIEGLELEDVILVGHSAGGTIALETFRAISNKIAHVIIYETPIYTLIKDEKPELYEWVGKMIALRDAGKHKEVAKEFAMSIGTMDPRARKKESEEKAMDREDFKHFITYEFPVFSFYEPNVEFFKLNSDYISVMVGDRSMDSNLSWASQNFAEVIGSKVYHVAGYHNLPYDLPLDFAVSVLGILRYRGL
ncbi:MAG: alpha/beta hydrolase [Eubacterium sp.]|nr:alpha/beta hydrolase [Eubacterium sp.]